MSEQDKARSVIYGLALGDALGWPIQFLTLSKINIIYGNEGIQSPPDYAEFTDDTQMSIAVAKALLEAGDADINTLMKHFRHHMLEWYNSPDNTRAAGVTVTEACRTMEAGIDWTQSGDPHARGGGSVNRAAPIGYFYQHDPERLREVAEATGIATHAHPVANASTIAAAYAVKLALDGVKPDSYLQRIMSFTEGISDEFDTTILRVGHVVAWNDEMQAMMHIGSGWVADETIAMALYCAIRHQDDFKRAVQRAVNHKGASDSVGCVTGGLMGARLGLGAIPEDWPHKLERFEELTDIADQLAMKKLEIYGRAS